MIQPPHNAKKRTRPEETTVSSGPTAPADVATHYSLNMLSFLQARVSGTSQVSTQTKMARQLIARPSPTNLLHQQTCFTNKLASPIKPVPSNVLEMNIEPAKPFYMTNVGYMGPCRAHLIAIPNGLSTKIAENRPLSLPLRALPRASQRGDRAVEQIGTSCMALEAYAREVSRSSVMWKPALFAESVLRRFSQHPQEDCPVRSTRLTQNQIDTVVGRHRKCLGINGYRAAAPRIPNFPAPCGCSRQSACLTIPSFWADSRRRIHEYQHVIIKPNEFEALGREGWLPGETVDHQTLRPVAE